VKIFLYYFSTGKQHNAFSNFIDTSKFKKIIFKIPNTFSNYGHKGNIKNKNKREKDERNWMEEDMYKIKNYMVKRADKNTSGLSISLGGEGC
jgi:hypothetical protein